MSGEKIGCRFNTLLIIAKAVSSIGIANINKGTKNEVSAGPLNYKREITAIINPSNWVQSPAKIVAG